MRIIDRFGNTSRQPTQVRWGICFLRMAFFFGTQSPRNGKEPPYQDVSSHSPPRLRFFFTTMALRSGSNSISTNFFFFFFFFLSSSSSTSSSSAVSKLKTSGRSANNWSKVLGSSSSARPRLSGAATASHSYSLLQLQALGASTGSATTGVTASVRATASTSASISATTCAGSTGSSTGTASTSSTTSG